MAIGSNTGKSMVRSGIRKIHAVFEVIRANCSKSLHWSHFTGVTSLESLHVDARVGPTRSSMSLPPEPTRFRCIYDPSVESNPDNRAGETNTVSSWLFERVSRLW